MALWQAQVFRKFSFLIWRCAFMAYRIFYGRFQSVLVQLQLALLLRGEHMSNPQSELVEFLAQFTHDPLGFVYSCFPWGKDELANYKGPDAWQVMALESSTHMF